MSKSLNILLVGSGGVGTIASYAIKRGSNVNMYSVVRSDFKRVNERGFDIDSVDYGEIRGWKPDYIVPNVHEAAKLVKSNAATEGSHDFFDFVVVCTKVLPELFRTEEIIELAVTERKTTIVLIQNGIFIEEPVASKYPNNIILSATSMIGSINKGGHVTQFEHDNLSVGIFGQKNLEKIKELETCKLFISLYGERADFVEDMMHARWKKLVYNSTINTIASLTQLDSGRLYLSGLDEALIVPAMKELMTVAEAYMGRPIKPDNIDRIMLESDDGIYYRPSMLIDLDKGNPIELEVILGNPVREAEKLNIPTPILSTVYHLLKGVQFRILEARGHLECPKKAPKRAEVKPFW